MLIPLYSSRRSLMLIRLIFAFSVLLSAVESFQHHLIHVNRHKLAVLSSLTRLRMSDTEEPNSMPLKVEQEIPSTDKAEPNASANVESNPVYANSMEEVTAPKTGFTEEKGAFDIGLLIAFPIMIGTLGFFLFFPYVAPQLAANSP